MYAAVIFSITTSVTSCSFSLSFHSVSKSLIYGVVEVTSSNLFTMLYLLFPRSHPMSIVVNPFKGKYTTCFSLFVMVANPIMPSSVVLDLNLAFFLIHSAHSLAIDFCVISLRSFNSNSVP